MGWILLLCVGGNDRIGKEKNGKNSARDKWEIPAIIPLIPILWVNHCLPILHLYKIFVHIYTIGKTINYFSIGYMINPSLLFNNSFRTQVEKYVGGYFSVSALKTIKNIMMMKNTYVMALIIIYKNNGEIPKEMYRVLSCADLDV